MALLSKKNKQEEKNDPANYFNLKEYNRKKIKNQDALFVISAIIIIIALIGLVSFFINFVVSQINLVFQDVSNSTAKIEVFDEKNFNEIKDKLIGVEDLKKQLEELLESETSTELNTSPLSETTTSEIINATTTEEGITSTPKNILENTTNSEILPTTSKTPAVKNSPTLTPIFSPSSTPSS